MVGGLGFGFFLFLTGDDVPQQFRVPVREAHLVVGGLPLLDGGAPALAHPAHPRMSPKEVFLQRSLLFSLLKKKTINPLSITLNPLQDDPKKTQNPDTYGSFEGLRPAAARADLGRSGVDRTQKAPYPVGFGFF